MRIYADHNATSPLAPEAREAIEAFVRAEPGNPGSVHQEGQRARTIVERSRRAVLRALGVRDGSVTFTSGATEANNLVLNTYIQRGPIVVSALDHPSVVEPATRFEDAGQGEVRWIPHDGEGAWDNVDWAELLKGAALVSVALANNELGTLRELSCLVAEAREAGTHVHLDAAQVFGRWAWTVPDGVDLVTLSAHKAGGLAGVGGLYAAERASFEPIVHGGHQERGRRPGTENVLGVASFGAIVARAATGWEHLAELRDYIEAELVALGGVPNGAEPPRIANTTNISFPGRDSEELLMALDLEGVALSAGSACAAGSIDPSPVLLALGVGEERARSAIRVSIGPGWDRARAEEFIRRARRVLGR